MANILILNEDAGMIESMMFAIIGGKNITQSAHKFYTNGLIGQQTGGERIVTSSPQLLEIILSIRPSPRIIIIQMDTDWGKHLIQVFKKSGMANHANIIATKRVGVVDGRGKVISRDRRIKKIDDITLVSIPLNLSDFETLVEEMVSVAT